jgi:hypothetical protein
MPATIAKAVKIPVLARRFPTSASNRGSSSCKTQKTKQTIARPNAMEKTVPRMIPSNTEKGPKFKSFVVWGMGLVCCPAS